MSDGWILSFVLALIFFLVVFLIINLNFPRMRIQKYLLPAFTFFIGAICVSVGILLLMDMFVFLIGFSLLVLAFIGALIGLVVDYFTRHRRTGEFTIFLR